MSDSYSLTLKEIAHRLHIGESTLNVWRNRYKEWMPDGPGGTRDHGPQSILDVFRLIARCTDAGFETREIERILQSMYGKTTGERGGSDETEREIETEKGPRDAKAEGPVPAPQDDGLKEVLSSLQTLMKSMVTQQERIAEAQERRAAAQERMAFAMESRAENEMVKTEVMRELVGAIQDMSTQQSVSSLMDRVKSISCPSPAELEDFSHDMGFDMDNLEELTVSPMDGPASRKAVFDFDETAGACHSSLDDSFDLGEKENVSFNSEHVSPNDPFAGPEPLSMDSLTDMDDLAALLEPDDLHIPGGMDDLSALLEPTDLETASGMDDLAALLEPGDLAGAGDMDDLSLLLEPGDQAPPDMDDLSMLIDDEPGGPMEPSTASEPSKPAEKTAVPGDENYKSLILKRIIHMKQKEKRSVEEVVRLFNAEGLKTLSGKDTWDARTIQGIFKYIDSFS